MWKDFKSFIARGSVMDLAIGIIIGAAFTAIVQSLVSDIIMPIAGLFTGGIDFSNMYINLSGGDYETLAAAQEAGAATVNYGLFINAIISFLIVAAAVFFIAKSAERMKRKAEDPQNKSVAPPRDIQLLTEIRDLLANEKNVQGS